MNKRHWERVKRLFTRARRIAPGQREAFLRRECKGDARLVSEVLRLLESEDQAAGFLDPPAEEDLALPLQSAGATLVESAVKGHIVIIVPQNRTDKEIECVAENVNTIKALDANGHEISFKTTIKESESMSLVKDAK